MSFRLVPKSVTFTDLERRNGPYFALFRRIRQLPGAQCVKVIEDVVGKSLRSLPHFLMSFLFTFIMAALRSRCGHYIFVLFLLLSYGRPV